MEEALFSAALLACLTALTAFHLTPWAAQLAAKAGAIDMPGPRRINGRPMPRLGGLAIISALMVGLGLIALFEPSLWRALWRPAWRALGISLALVFVTGLTDDLRSMSVGGRLVTETSAALLTAAFLALPLTHGGALLLPAMVTTLWLVAVCNASNLIDGLDGLFAGVALIEVAGLLALAVWQGRRLECTLLGVAAGALAGFFLRNRHPAQIFAGDAGALTVGFALGAAALRLTAHLSGPLRLEVVCLLLGYPFTELATTTLRRLLRTGEQTGSSAARVRSAARRLFQPDRDHIHHRLLEMGWSQPQAAVICYGLSLLLMGLGVMIAVLPSTCLAGGGLGLVAMAGLVSWLRYDELRLWRGGTREVWRPRVGED